jgi:hypothetical protein
MLFSKTRLTLVLAASAFAAELRGAQDQRERQLTDCQDCAGSSYGQCLQSNGVCWPAVNNVCPYYAPTPCDGDGGDGGTAPTGCDRCSGTYVCAFDDGSRCVGLQGVICTPGTHFCPTSTTACVNSASGAGTDYQCSSAGYPVCALTSYTEPAYGGFGTSCKKCIDNYAWWQNAYLGKIDTGCSSSSPKCYYTSWAGEFGCHS